ncbi:MAG: hypothetical protein ACRD0A_10780 [Acidimicrobiales bacterium]
MRATLQLLYDVALGFGNVGDPAPCILGTTNLDAAGEGLLYYRRVISLIDGSEMSAEFRCIGPGEDPVPPPPPTRQEIFGSALIPRPVIHTSPYGDGLVGLDTWLWGDAHGSVTVSLTLRGWTVTGTVTAVEWIFETSDGGSYSADNPGSEARPVGRHVFSRYGTYTIDHTVAWGGSFAVTGYGFTINAGNLGAAFDATRSYDVIEVEAVGRNPD